MLENGTVGAVVAVSDIEKAKEFYGGTLNLKQIDENPAGVLYKSGDGTLFMYESPNAGTNKATTANWNVDDLKAVVEDLKSKGITFERYDFPGAEYDGDIHIMGQIQSAWFKDPDGNIFGISSMG